MRDFTVPLKDARKIGFIEHGDTQGIPVMFFHWKSILQSIITKISKEVLRIHKI